LHSQTLRIRLACLAVACVAPVWLAAGFLVHQSYQDKQALVEQHMLDTARALTLTVDQYLSSVQTTLRLLATSPALGAGDLAAFHSQARAVLVDYPGADIILADADGQQRVNTYRAFGEPLPRRNIPDSVHRLFATGQPVITGLFKGAITKRPMIGLDVPVIHDNQVIYDLSMTFPVDRLGNILLLERLPATWLGAIIDHNGMVAARTLAPDRFVGQPARPVLQRQIAELGEGTLEMPTFEGIPGTWAFSRSPGSGWTVALCVPTNLLLADARRWLLWTIVGAALLSVCGIGLALVMGQRIARSIQALASPAAALGRGEPVAIGPLDLSETDEVGQALTRASRLLQERSQERDQAERTLAERTRMLERHYRNLRSLNEITALSQGATGELLSQALALGARHLGLATGIISHVEGQRYTVEYRVDPPGADPATESEFELEATCCALPLAADDVVAIPRLSRSPQAGHPCLPTAPVECYIGAPVRVYNQPYGTVHFASATPYRESFDDGDLEFMRLLARWIGTMLERDLSDREIRTARIDAETASRAKTEFLAMMSHEIRTPLTVILGFSEILRDQIFGPIGNPTYAEYATDINTSGHHLLDVVNDILDITKIEAGKMEITPELIEPSTLLATTIRLVRERALRNALVIDSTTPRTLPPLWADPRAAKQILFNLLFNAIKFTPEHGRITVTAAATRQGGLAITVADTGVGIPPDQLERVLRPFERIDNRYIRKAGGTGLGLPLVKALTELHGGTLSIDSTPGVGTTVTVGFPPPPA
jgi:signal transduction histidine kinase